MSGPQEQPMTDSIQHYRERARRQVTAMAYEPTLTPLPLTLRPHVLAQDRLHLWKPIHARKVLDNWGIPVNLDASDLE